MECALWVLNCRLYTEIDQHNPGEKCRITGLVGASSQKVGCQSPQFFVKRRVHCCLFTFKLFKFCWLLHRIQDSKQIHVLQGTNCSPKKQNPPTRQTRKIMFESWFWLPKKCPFCRFSNEHYLSPAQNDKWNVHCEFSTADSTPKLTSTNRGKNVGLQVL